MAKYKVAVGVRLWNKLSCSCSTESCKVVKWEDLFWASLVLEVEVSFICVCQKMSVSLRKDTTLRKTSKTQARSLLQLPRCISATLQSQSLKCCDGGWKLNMTVFRKLVLLIKSATMAPVLFSTASTKSFEVYCSDLCLRLASSGNGCRGSWVFKCSEPSTTPKLNTISHEQS